MFYVHLQQLYSESIFIPLNILLPSLSFSGRFQKFLRNRTESFLIWHSSWKILELICYRFVSYKAWSRMFMDLRFLILPLCPGKFKKFLYIWNKNLQERIFFDFETEESRIFEESLVCETLSPFLFFFIFFLSLFI